MDVNTVHRLSPREWRRLAVVLAVLLSAPYGTYALLNLSAFALLCGIREAEATLNTFRRIVQSQEECHDPEAEAPTQAGACIVRADPGR